MKTIELQLVQPFYPQNVETTKAIDLGKHKGQRWVCTRMNYVELQKYADKLNKEGHMLATPEVQTTDIQYVLYDYSTGRHVCSQIVSKGTHWVANWKTILKDFSAKQLAGIAAKHKAKNK